MGVVKRDIHKNEHKFKQISLSDVDCIKGLIKYRSMIDEYYNYDSEDLKNIQAISLIVASKELDRKNKEDKRKFEELKSQGLIDKKKKFKPAKLKINDEVLSDQDKRISASHITEVNQELIAIYADLDKLIENASLSKKQRIILDLLMCGLNETDIAFYFKQNKHKIVEIVDTICSKLKRDYDRQWKYSLAEQDLIKVEWDYKVCSKCKRNLPLTEDYYRKQSDCKDGFRPECRKCESSAKK
jgi:DNA-binding NarL/FixJ family response regulator